MGLVAPGAFLFLMCSFGGPVYSDLSMSAISPTFWYHSRSSMRFSTTSELSLGGEKAGAVEGVGAEGVAAGGVALEAAPCAKALPVNRSRDARTRIVDRGVRREAKLKMELLDVGMS